MSTEHQNISNLFKQDEGIKTQKIVFEAPRTSLDTRSVVAKLQQHLDDNKNESDSNKTDSPSNYSLLPNSPVTPENIPIVLTMPKLADVHENTILQPKTTVGEYTVKKLVGRGGFAKVYKVRRKADGQIFAMKVMRKEHVRKMKQVANVINEKKIQKVAESTFIVKIYASFQDHIHLFLIQEFLEGGDLFSYIKQYGHFCDADAKFYSAELFLALSFLHGIGIVYRDLKPENILFTCYGHLKIADMGFAKVINDEKARTFCGTPSYLAPEVLERKPYDYAVDWWSYGVLVFQLCAGCSPFQESHPTKTFARILNCAIRWPPVPQNYFTSTVFDLIMGLFELDPEIRMKEQEIRAHEWFEGMDFDLIANRSVSPPKGVMKNLNVNLGSDSSNASLGLSEGDYKQSTDDLFSDF